MGACRMQLADRIHEEGGDRAVDRSSMDDDDIADASFNSLLYCDEDPFDSTPPPPPPPPPEQQQRGTTTPDDDDEVMEYYKAKQRWYPLQRDYCCYLQCHHHLLQQQGVAAARLKAVRYIIYAMGRLGLEAATAFNAVNYLDRFLSINCHLGWEEWMVEVVSVACLSLACKLDEVTIPSLHDLQMEEAMGHSFRASTIRDMELTLLKALRWRLACVTPFSFLTAAADSSRGARALLLRSLLDPSFLRFDASLLAASALTLSCTAQHPNHLVNRLIHPLSQTDHEVKECFNMMKTLHLDLSDNPDHQYWSPISVVIPFQTDGTVNRSAVSRCLFGSGGLKPDQSDGDTNTEEDKDSSGLWTCVQEMK